MSKIQFLNSQTLSKSIFKTKLNLFKKICLIRFAEDHIKKFYHEDDMKTPMHMSKGEEGILSAIIEVLKDKSDFFGYYRSHALYLSVTEDLKKFFCEMYGKFKGANKGIGGSMHIYDPLKNMMAVSAVVSSTIAPGVGSAYANKLSKNKKISTILFGDGATEEGVFWESINIAVLKKLPALFICLNNELAVDVPIKIRQSYKISNAVKQFNIKTFFIKERNPYKIFNEIKKVYDYMKKNNKPAFIQIKYFRILQHIGINNDFEVSKTSFERKSYKSIKDYNKNLKDDPYVVSRLDLIKSKMISEKKIENMENKIKKEVDRALKYAKKAKFPKTEFLKKNVFK